MRHLDGDGSEAKFYEKLVGLINAHPWKNEPGDIEHVFESMLRRAHVYWSRYTAICKWNIGIDITINKKLRMPILNSSLGKIF